MLTILKAVKSGLIGEMKRIGAWAVEVLEQFDIDLDTAKPLKELILFTSALDLRILLVFVAFG